MLNLPGTSTEKLISFILSVLSLKGFGLQF